MYLPQGDRGLLHKDYIWRGGRQHIALVADSTDSCRIFEIPEKNVQHIKQAQGLVDPFPGWVLRMRGLPYSANAEDVVSNLHELCCWKIWAMYDLLAHG